MVKNTRWVTYNDQMFQLAREQGQSLQPEADIDFLIQEPLFYAQKDNKKLPRFALFQSDILNFLCQTR